MGGLWQITLREGRPLSAVELAPSGRLIKKTEPLWTIQDLCRRSGKSRRQIYRDIKSGKIKALGIFLREWLLDPSSLASLKPPPPSLPSLLPEFDSAALDLEALQDVVIGRILRFGGRDRLRWAFSYYGESAVKTLLLKSGARLLDPRTLRFWSLYFKLPVPPASRAAAKGRKWGGF